MAIRLVAMVIALVCAACSGTSTLSAPPVPAASVVATPASRPTPSTTPSPTPSSSPIASPSAGVDPATAFGIAPPYALERPSAEDLDQLSGNIQGLSSDLAKGAGAGFAPSDFPMGFRFILDADRRVGVLVVLAMPTDVAELPGLLESVAAPVAAEVNAVLSYETLEDVKVGVVRGPIASALAILDGHLVMAQSGQPAVHPRDLMSAVIAGSEAGIAAPTSDPS